jgi:hypothetical protein
MNRDQIERSLRQPGPRERGYLPVGLPATLADADRPRPQRALLFAARVATFAVAVAGGAILAVVLTRGGGTPGPGNGPSASPSSSEGPSPSPAAVAACRAGDFAWSPEPWGGAAGSRGTSILAKVVSSVAVCDIDGQARIVLKDANGTELATTVAPATRLTLRAGETVEMELHWSNWCAAIPPLPISVSVTLPDRPVTLTPEGGAFGVPDNRPCTGAPSLSATSFQPTTRTPQG